MKVGGFSETIVPSGWTRWAAADGKLIKCGASAGSTGGNGTHVHTVSFSSGVTGDSVLDEICSGFPGQSMNVHTHTIPAASGITSSAGSSLPKTKALLFVWFNEVFDEV